MRRKTFDVLFSTRDGMEMLVKEKCLWRSLWYFTMSVGLFCGVITNQLFLEQPLSVRFGIIAVVLVITGVCLLMYGFLLHGILCTMGALAGDAVGLICLLGYTTLPFLMLTPVALLKHEIVIYRHFCAGGGNSGRAAVDGISFGAFFAVGIPY